MIEDYGIPYRVSEDGSGTLLSTEEIDAREAERARRAATEGQILWPREIKAILNGKQIAEAREIGTSWGKEEAGLWLDEGLEYRSWTRGRYCGNLNALTGTREREAFESVIDDAASEAWNAAFEPREDADAWSGGFADNH